MIQPLLQRLLVAVNGSENSLHAAMYAIMLAKQQNCAVRAVYVVDTATIRSLTLTKVLISEEGAYYAGNLEANGQRYLDQVVELGKSKGVAVETELRRGAVFSEIVKAADDYKASLILAGGTAYKTAFSGGTDELIDNVRCNVLFVHAPHVDKLFKLL
ncbi:MAG: universal stress protein [Treponema sp.]|nr:universal stress protein [Treponema sp.]